MLQTFKLSALTISLLFIANSAQAAPDVVTTTSTTTSKDGTVVKRTIVTTTPEPKATVPVPSGYVSCFTVKGNWYNDVWAAEHDVCSYSNSPDGVVWIQGYWQCDKYDVVAGQCFNWLWKEAHWEKTVNIY